MKRLVIAFFILFVVVKCHSAEAKGPVWNDSIIPQVEIDCLALNIYFEARNESYEGRLAVAQVTQNRVMSKRYPNSYCGVVWEHRKHPDTGKTVAQFSWTLDGKSDTPHNLEVWKECLEIAEEVLIYRKKSDIIDTSVLNYHATYVKPKWSYKLVPVAQIERHIFYTNTKR